MAAWSGHEATIKMLVESLDANKEGRDKCGWTALHVAAMNGCDAASQGLVENLGADKEAKDDAGWTALHFVAALGREDTAHLLIKTLGVDRDSRTNEGQTAHDLAQECDIYYYYYDRDRCRRGDDYYCDRDHCKYYCRGIGLRDDDDRFFIFSHSDCLSKPDLKSVLP